MFYLINIISLKILFGIIIETFAELRNLKNREDYDRYNICFICNLEKYLFLKKSFGFTHHIIKHHNLWHYVFYMYNLKQKNVTDMNGVESYVHFKLDTDDITWLPLRRALCLETNEV